MRLENVLVPRGAPPGEDSVRAYYGYVPRFIGGPRDGERADAGWSTVWGQGDLTDYFKSPGIDHYYHAQAIAAGIKSTRGDA